MPDSPVAQGSACEGQVLEYLQTHPEITNTQARLLTGLLNEDRMKHVFYRLRERGLIQKVEGRSRKMAAWQLVKEAIQSGSDDRGE